MKVNTLLRILPILLVIAISSCKKDDPCDGIVCQNSGVCVNGECDCPQGFSGPDCSNQITPTSISITNIKVTRFPATDAGGAGWDLTSGADIYVALFYNNAGIYTHPTFFQNADPSIDYDFVPNVNLTILNPTNRYIIALYDFDDFDADDLMGAVEFIPYSNTNGFPSKLVVDGGASVAFELTVEYKF